MIKLEGWTKEYRDGEYVYELTLNDKINRVSAALVEQAENGEFILAQEEKLFRQEVGGRA